MTMSFHNGAGYHSMWGFSPCLNLLQYCRTIDPSSIGSTNDPIRILLLHPSDPRHLMKTISQSLRKDSQGRPIHFYVMEPTPEILARHLVLLHILFDWHNTPIRERAAEFLEIYGNTLLSMRSAVYLERCANILHDLVFDAPCSSEVQQFVDFTDLKQRDRDDLAKILRSWTNSDPYNVISYREERMRSYYGGRYDCRENIIDWDYHNGVKTVASIIHRNEFLDWRMTGVGFKFGNRTYSVPNKTTASFLNGTINKGPERGLVKAFQGYWLDIIIGPYICFGVMCDQKDDRSEHLFQVINKGTGAEQHVHNASEVSLYNIISLMWELETGQQYKMAYDHDIYSGLGREAETADSNRRPIFDVKIVLLKGVDLDEITRKTRHENFFDHVYLSQHMVHQLESRHLASILKRNGTFSIETPIYIFPLSRSQKEQWDKKLSRIQMSGGFHKICDVNQTSGTVCFAFKN